MFEKKSFKIFRILALLLAVVLFLTGVIIVPNYNNPFLLKVKADQVLTVNLGEANKSGDIVTFPNATISGADKVTSMMFFVSAGYIVGDNEWDFKDILQKHKTTTKVWKEGVSLSDAQNFLRSVQFGYEENIKVTVKVDANDMNLPSSANISAFEPVEGAGQHYYMFVPTGTNDPGWRSAYDNAKTWVFMGMKGYLATITSQEEDKTLDSISLAGAWAGGARIDKNTTQLDQNTSDSYQPVSPSSNTAWMWVCGPEAGERLYLDPRCNAVSMGHCEYAATGYANWGTDKWGVPNQPDGYATSASSLGEWNLQLHFANAGNQATWNDLPETYPSLITGYYVEFSDYDGGHVPSYNSQKTATVTAEHIHSWGYTEKKNTDETSSQVLAYCQSDPNVSLCQYSGEANALTVSLSANDVPFSQSQYDASNVVITGADILNALNGATCSDITYYKKADRSIPTDSSDGASTTGGAPSKVGTYYAAVTITDKDDVTKKAVAMDVFSIGKGTYPTDMVTTSMAGYVYANTPSTPEVSGIPDGEDPDITYWYYKDNKSDAVQWDVLNPPNLNAGVYHIFAKVGESVSFVSFETAPADFTVSKKTITTLEWDNLDFVYNGTEQIPTVTIPAAQIAGSDIVNAIVTGGQTNAGTHEALASVDNDNYELDSSIKTKTFTIEKALLEIIPADQTIVAGKKIISDVTGIKFSGLFAPDTPQSVLGSEALSSIKVKCEEDYSTAGEYTLAVELPVGLGATNYELNPSFGTLTVSSTAKGTKIYPEEPSSGQVITETIKEKNLPPTELTNLTKDVAEALLDQAEKEAVQTGSDVLIYLDLTDATSDVTDEEMSQFEKTKSKEYTLYTDLVLDLSLYKRTITDSVSSEPVKLETIDKEVSVEVELPQELINKDNSYIRTYQIIRKHTVGTEDTYETIPAKYSNGKVTFKTNKFSDYAIAFYDTKKPSGSGDGDGSGGDSSPIAPVIATNAAMRVPAFGAVVFESPKTGDTGELYVLVILLMVGIALIFVDHRKKSSKKL